MIVKKYNVIKCESAILVDQFYDPLNRNCIFVAI